MSASSNSNNATNTSNRRIPTFDIDKLPSITDDGMTVQEEATKRKKTSRFIEEACRILKLHRVATATALVFFHRFYAKHSFGKHDRFEVAVACILLAAKTEESPRKVVNVLEECHNIRSRSMAASRMNAQNNLNGNSPASSGTSGTIPTEPLDPKSEEFNRLKERILLLERVVLHTIGFELSVDHPYKFIVERIKQMIQRRQIDFITPKPGMNPQQSRDKLMNEVVQYAMSFANDSFQTSLCIQYPAESIAKACVFLGGQHAKTDADWLNVLEVGLDKQRYNYGDDLESFASICVQLLELCSEKRINDKTKAAFRAMRNELEKLRLANNNSKDNNNNAAPPRPSPPTRQPSPKRQRNS